MTLRDDFESITSASIQDFVSSRREEDLHLDFKAVEDTGLTRSDRKSLAIGLSGYGNADGGLLVWGIDARPGPDGTDCAAALREISNARLCLSRLNEFTGQAVSPPVGGVEHRAIYANGDSGYCVTLVPASDAGPHMAKAGEDRYFKRSGSAFYRMEHFDLEDVFGRRPRPKLGVVYRVMAGGSRRGSGGTSHTVFVVLGIRNDGRGLAHHVYLTLDVEPPYQLAQHGLDGNGHEGMVRIPSPGRPVRFVAVAGSVVHPNVTHDVTRVKLEIHEDSNRIPDVVVRYELAAQGIALSHGTLTIPVTELVGATQV